MNTTALTKKQQQVNDLTEYANLLQQNGFTVIVSKKHPFEWIYFEKDGKIGTVSPGNFYGLNFSSVHKPCRECGTGFSTDREVTEPTIKHAENTLLHSPNWATPYQRKAVIKYKDVNDFISSTNNKWAEYYIM